MGIIRMGPPAELMISLKIKYGVSNFIETGSYYGNTASWAAQYFDQVITIEKSEKIFQETSGKLNKIGNIKFLLGDSRLILREIVLQLKETAIFWLDAHWSGGDTYGEIDVCPIINEIQTINLSQLDHFIFIDDARLFCSPPPLPNRIEQWPAIMDIIEALKHKEHKRYMVIMDDVIIAAPEPAKETIASYCQENNTREWRAQAEIYSQSKTERGLRLIAQGMKLMGSDIKSKTRERFTGKRKK